MAVSVGQGSYSYEVAEGWKELPAGYEWGQIGAVAVDSKNQVYTFTRTDHPLMVFDKEGNFLRSWGEGLFKDAHGLCFDAEDNMYFVDRACQVVMKYTADGQKVFELGQPRSAFGHRLQRGKPDCAAGWRTLSSSHGHRSVSIR